MQLPMARYYDGHTAAPHNVTFAIGRDTDPQLMIAAPDGVQLDGWPLADIFEVAARADELRLGARNRPSGARLVMSGDGLVTAARKLLPDLVKQQRADRGEQLRLIGLATGALVSVIVAYMFGVPLLARNIVPLVPAQWEADLGETARQQIDQIVGFDGIAIRCDTDPDSLANRAIRSFATEVMEGTGSPFAPDIQVVYSDIPNAFALPGGSSYYFSALLAQTESPDEFAGVMAHELGHVYHRHGLEGLIESSATGLLVGFVLGDLTGLSVAGGLGAAMIDTRFSRDAERQADQFAAAAGQRMGFNPAALADLLERVAGDSHASQMLQIFSSHPLTADRRAALEAAPPAPAGRQVFSPDEWQAIKTMCDPARPTERLNP
jgi:predicted Zn-dependent protease